MVRVYCASSSLHEPLSALSYQALRNSSKKPKWGSYTLPSCTVLGQGGSGISAGCSLFNLQEKHASYIKNLGNTEADITQY